MVENWKLSVQNYLDNLNNILINYEKCKELYFGFEVIDGLLIENPKILFIGINPGAGNGKKEYKIKMNSERISYLDYFDDEYNYPLAKETIEVFKIAGFSENEIIDLFTNSVVKTNLFHITTRLETDIKKCFDLCPELSYNEYWKKSVEFTINLIKTINPNIVIFEGKSVYDNIVKECYEIKNSWNEYGVAHYYSDEDKCHFIGYKRLFSNIQSDKNALGQTIKNCLSE
ncbi:hypothetical protein [Flavobacterium psychrophilum]|uniref:hypothetical protein n=1 Tax=Flavobacterium psychrophilum TaxID=96345 RepID=UPI0033946A7F